MVRGNITIMQQNLAAEVAKVDGTTIDNAEDLHLVIPIYNLLEYGFLRLILTQQVGYAFIQNMKQLIVMPISITLISLNDLSKRLG